LFFKTKKENQNPSLEDLIEGCKRGDSKAQKALYKHFFAYSKSICLRYCAWEEDADEVLNDSFVKVFRKIDQYNALQPFKMWLRTILINTAIDQYRRQQKLVPITHVEHALEKPFDDAILENLSAQEILALVQKLTPGYRTVFMLYAIDGFNHREIGEMLGISEGTSKSNLSKAREKLQEMIRQHFPDTFSSYGNRYKAQ
jgi:RNA polymerase sigma-70 factor, ECF subfamily